MSFLRSGSQSEEGAHANALPANIDDMYDYLTEAGEVNWRPVVPDALKGAMTTVGIAEPEARVTVEDDRRARPVVPVKKQ